MKAFESGVAVCILVSVLCCGCETYSAMRSGELTLDDFKQMINYGFNIHPPQAPVPQAAEARPTEVKTGTPLIQKVRKMDAWFQENLW